MAPIHEDRNRGTLIAFMREELDWPAPPDLPTDEMFYDYSADELRLDQQTAERVQVRQLARFSPGQPWGVFLLETATPRLYATQLRRLLRGLAPAARSRRPNLPAWPAQNLLFIATHDYHQFTFAHFKGDRVATARLSTFGWEYGDVGLRTLCEYNLPALAWPDDENDAESWLKQWERAFDVEVVTDKFFREFRDLFEDVKAALPKSIRQPTDRHAFTQRLLNRLLFLCFLQKKRWLKAADLAHPRTTYLFDLFDSAIAQGEEFYADYLYDLFFNALNRPPSLGDDRERDRLAQKLGFVPFLNGGLFDQTDALDAPGAVVLPNGLFLPILGPDGLLRRYNFTVTESTPLNKEVAVDPEMLGKVFETVVLASEGAKEYRAPNLRKATGSSYTPRIVVTFIVRETLKEYLTARVPGLTKARLTRLMETDAAAGLDSEARTHLRDTVTQKQAEAIRAQLVTLRACDPAIGSGAFALGLLHELVNLYILCETVERGRDPRLGQPNLVFGLKKHIIEQNIYGVDLQAKAVEICKLRLWLSLIVDYEVDVDLDVCTDYQFERAVSKIPALPNLSYKIRRGDALLDLVHGHTFHMQEIGHSEAMQDERAALAKAHRTFFGAQDPSAKRKLRLEALVHRTRLTGLQLGNQRAMLRATTGTQMDMFDQKQTKAEIRKSEAALAEMDAALAEVRKTETALEPLIARRRLTQADDDLITQLEASSEGEEITFIWGLDFPAIFSVRREAARTFTGAMRVPVNQTPGQMKLHVREIQRGGFDIIMGNPPFLTARNPEKRRLYRERWKETCYKSYQLVAPFFQRSFSLLRPGGHLGFIVSNAFAKRGFGKPLVEDFFPTVELQKAVDCSGLMFPGHGPPTCIMLGCNRHPASDSAIRIAATLPGGGDLRTPPEHSPLWATLQAHHDQPGYSDERIMVADRPWPATAKWPWNFDVSIEPTRKMIEGTDGCLLDHLTSPVGYVCITKGDEVFFQPQHLIRRLSPNASYVLPLSTGNSIRNWSRDEAFALFPYDPTTFRVAKLKDLPYAAFLSSFRAPLSKRITYGKSQAERGKWFEYAMMSPERMGRSYLISMPEISTHNHAIILSRPFLASQTAPVSCPRSNSIDDYHLLVALLNSSAALLWLKSVCFSKRAAKESAASTYYVLASGKVQQLPIPSAIFEPGPLRDRLTTLSRVCWERGQELPGLAFKKLFEMKGETYYAWNSSLKGWVKPWSAKLGDWGDAEGLNAAREAYTAERERLRREMIALQEEMDWLVYAAYGLLPADHPAVGMDGDPAIPGPLSLGERPFELANDGKPVPQHFSPQRRALWETRINVIGENEHVRRIEHPVYKRRWYRKVSDAQEFRRAFEWWLLEKAEWWLEHKASGGPVTLEGWAAALWEDERVRAAVEVAEGKAVASSAFARLFKSAVVKSTVPDWIPPAMAWKQVEKKFKKVPARARRIRGRLNVPRERFRLTADGAYVWAGKEVGGGSRKKGR